MERKSANVSPHASDDGGNDAHDYKGDASDDEEVVKLFPMKKNKTMMRNSTSSV